MRNKSFVISIFILIFCYFFQFIPVLFDKLVSVNMNISIINNADEQNYNNITRHDKDLTILMNKISSEISNIEDITYMYIDNSGIQGTMNYYRLRSLALHK